MQKRPSALCKRTKSLVLPPLFTPCSRRMPYQDTLIHIVLIYPCTITGASPPKPTGKILFSLILQDVFIPVSACASHPPAAFCWLSLLLLILFFVFNTINRKKPVYAFLPFYRKFLQLSNSFSRIFH